MSAPDEIDVIPVEIAGTILGLDQRWVRICEGEFDVTYVPGAPAFVAGIVNVEGRIHAVVYFEMLLGLMQQPDAADKHFLVLARKGEMEFGFGAHSVGRMRRVQRDELGSPGYDSDWVLGETADGLTVLDLETVLGDSSLLELPPDAPALDLDAVDTSALDVVEPAARPVPRLALPPDLETES